MDTQKAPVAYLEVMSQHLLGQSKEHHQDDSSVESITFKARTYQMQAAVLATVLCCAYIQFQYFKGKYIIQYPVDI